MIVNNYSLYGACIKNLKIETLTRNLRNFRIYKYKSELDKKIIKDQN
jgi:hypothetical protein